MFVPSTKILVSNFYQVRVERILTVPVSVVLVYVVLVLPPFPPMSVYIAPLQ